MYIVDLGFGECLVFETLEDAIEFCEEVFSVTNKVLNIVKI